MSAAVVISGYLAGVALRGAADEDGVETQSRVDVDAGRAAAHAALTIDALVPDGGGSPGGVLAAGSIDAFRDVDAGARAEVVARDALHVRLSADGHVLDDGAGGRGGAAYAGAIARGVAWDAELGLGRVWFDGVAGDEVLVRIGRRHVASWLDVGATAIATEVSGASGASGPGGSAATGAELSAGGDVVVHATSRLAFTVEALDGSRTHALLSHGAWLESVSGTQHGWARAIATVDLGRLGTIFVAAAAREDTTAGGATLTVVDAFVGSTVPL